MYPEINNRGVKLCYTGNTNNNEKYASARQDKKNNEQLDQNEKKNNEQLENCYIYEYTSDFPVK